MRRSKVLADHALQPGEYEAVEDILLDRIAASLSVGSDLSKYSERRHELLLRILIKVCQLRGLSVEGVPPDE